MIPSATTDLPTTPYRAEVDPFSQGLPRPVVLRLLSGPGKFSKADYALYRSTPHWQERKLATVADPPRGWGRACLLCGVPHAQVHHTPEGYRNLFREDVRLHLRPLCSTCHKKHHRK